MEQATEKCAIYTVKRGDTLTKIAKVHQTTPEELARINHLSNMNIIKVGQNLLIRPAAPQESDEDEEEIDMTGQLFLKFVGALEKPISKMKVWIKAGAEEYEHVTDFRGEIPFIYIKNPDTPVTVQVQKAAGGKKTVSTFAADTGRNTSALLVSPKYAKKAGQQVHKGQPPQTQTQTQTQTPSQAQTNDTPPEAGTAINTRSSNGHPLQQVFVECPNGDNLKLGIFNGKHRKIILDAAKRAGMQPQAIAAVIDAEAAKKTNIVTKAVVDKSGKPVIDKKTGKEKTVRRRDTSEWNERSIALGDSSATGMTQFLDGSWIDMALTDGSYLNQWVNGKGWLTTKEVETITKKKVRNIKTNKIEVVEKKSRQTKRAFQLANGELVTGGRIVIINGKRTVLTLPQVLSLRPYKTANRTASDRNLQELLDMRFVPEYAIRAAVDYAVSNIKGLVKKGYPVDSLNDAEKAKVMYLCHHLGLGGSVAEPGAREFINNTITPVRAERLLRKQFAANRQGRAQLAKEYRDAGNDWVKAHREWLRRFVEKNILITNFMCIIEGAPVARDLLVITDYLKDNRQNRG